ncbi:serine protease : Trypsin-like protein serine protease typically periplasmic containing C-terminal PDZ domain OS=Planctomyces limnophilus (strain ATCC 43296 / DSM 3776 / IFAM 1008 / 290) GN=Plim_1010 PE=4 SV=1: Trypsin_2 [Gemmataceae bacterium]|nr:serine protease : Trypsin-like protein serine protease typically periplasmic containing C-terminal PDZ domain OS=Planctomyces limnophilus (strain ATCC 43296 / DSM 3776 / IFAM 1008 / 290) GN=Plim_1010 PE=4 SV=1: Trypsin_2 [Gemmataceae bacterium]VTU00772.1 serine protease : Trypsin-like protein serine protease typically periplasmic containing C-terminal PDZ domain OS=Planctomyces limnophilus (strain ATCC 43296 / DSM 3776 / IFAM 1008 / 290) GN=Plim_1010 PE=4 SV=1: Trypsin_2 [Gemmataceae bacterium]
MSRLALFVLAAAVAGAAAAAQPPVPAPKAAAPAPAKPWFVDDAKLFEDFMAKLTELGKAGKCLANDKLHDKMKPGTRAKLAPAKPGDKALSPEEVYKVALPSVFIVGSVFKDKDGEWQDGLYATAWAASADGVLVSNWHVFEDLEPNEVFGVADHKGTVYPVVDFLGGDKAADVAVFKIDARGLTPLPVADEFAAVGSWVGVLSHPGDNFYLYTTGSVTRYSTNKNDDGKRERWMGLTAEFAGGSSGSPVLNKYGAVVGMSALTLTIEDGVPVPAPVQERRRLRARFRDEKPKAPPPKEKDKPEPKEEPKPAPGGGATVQMVLKMAVPGPTILKSFEK